MQGQLIDLQKSIKETSLQLQSDLHFQTPNLRALKEKCNNQDETLVIRRTKFALNIGFELIDGESNVLDLIEIEHLRIALPYKYQLYHWQLLYTTNLHGRRLQAIYNRSKKCSPMIMLISGMNNSKFGVFLPDGFQDKRNFYGSESTFVFSIDKYIKIFNSTGRNQFFVSSLSTAFIVGGNVIEKGNTFGSAIYFDSSIDHGYSNPCPTFDSPPVSGELEFSIDTLELWHLIPKKPNYENPFLSILFLIKYI
jgi:hypothetical protein